MKRKRMVHIGTVAGVLVIALSMTAAHAERRPPYGADAQLLEANVREQIQRRVGPVLEEMAPGQAELKFIDVRVAKAISAEATPGFDEQTPGQEFVVDHVEVALTLDSKLPPQFRKDLKNLVKSKLEMLSVPLEITDS